ncbi:protein At-4/1 isoform X3 [Durio zibethinus]|uniref:Protein At-4/1 isoform X3 n=1 Tax=Durio zibethinus TaxID=66656 RepID=A0A6P5ZM21_DURZI|nr:protein At-4/1 isoform X3 [Durio zibethinus]
MAATSELRIDSLLSGFDQICEDFKRRIEEIQFLKSNWNAEIKRREALEFTCDSLKQDNARLTKLYTESLNNLAEQLENRAICQRLKELQRRNDEYQSKEEEHRKAVELLKKDHLKEVGDLEAKVRGLLLEKATNEATTSQLQKDLATQKDQVQVLSKRLDQLHSDKESELLISRMKLVEQQGDSASNRQVETLKLKIMKLRKENEILKRKLSSVQES